MNGRELREFERDGVTYRALYVVERDHVEELYALDGGAWAPVPITTQLRWSDLNAKR